AVRDFVAAYNERHGATVLLTSHYMADVTALCRRVMVIDSGDLIFDGDLSSLVERTAPQKLLKLEFRVPQSEAVLRGSCELRARSGRRAERGVARAGLTGPGARLSNDLPIADIGIEEVPIEEIIGQVFCGRQAARAEAAK